jgi:hypothetical protein
MAARDAWRQNNRAGLLSAQPIAVAAGPACPPPNRFPETDESRQPPAEEAPSDGEREGVRGWLPLFPSALTQPSAVVTSFYGQVHHRNRTSGRKTFGPPLTHNCERRVPHRKAAANTRRGGCCRLACTTSPRAAIRFLARSTWRIGRPKRFLSTAHHPLPADNALLLLADIGW